MIELTKTDKKKLLGCFKKNYNQHVMSMSYDAQGKPAETMTFYPIENEKIENKLFAHYGLVTDHNFHKTLQFSFWYNWSGRGGWMVGA